MSGDASSPRRYSAVSRDSIRDGAVISYSGDTGVVGGMGIVESVESQLLGPIPPRSREDRWLMDAVPVLSRGAAWIVPLFSAPQSADNGEEAGRTLDIRATELGQSIRSACWYLHGDPLSIDLAGRTGGPGVYSAELVRTGAKNAFWWACGNSAVVLVYYGERSPAPKTRMALHGVPLGWVSTRRPTPVKKMQGLDLAWSWQDVVAFAESNAAGSPTHEQE